MALRAGLPDQSRAVTASFQMRQKKNETSSQLDSTFEKGWTFNGTKNTVFSNANMSHTRQGPKIISKSQNQYTSIGYYSENQTEGTSMQAKQRTMMSGAPFVSKLPNPLLKGLKVANRNMDSKNGWFSNYSNNVSSYMQQIQGVNGKLNSHVASNEGSSYQVSD